MHDNAHHGTPCPPTLLAMRLLLAHDYGDADVLDDTFAEFLGDEQDDGGGGCANCAHGIIMNLLSYACSVGDRLDEVLGHTEDRQMWPQYIASQLWKGLDSYQKWLIDHHESGRPE